MIKSLSNSSNHFNYPFQRLFGSIGAGICLAVLDLAIKQFAIRYFTEYPQPIELIKSLFYLRLEKNTALAFSIALPFELILLLNSVVFAALILFLAYKLDFNKKSSILIFVMLFGGAMSNLYERFSQAFVTDFLAFGNFPVFNFADSFITISIFLLILFYDRITR